MIAKIKQYKNLLLVILVAVLLIVIIVADPLGFCVSRAHARAAIRNQMAIEKAEAEQQIAIIEAQTAYDLEQIAKGNKVQEYTTSGNTVAVADTDTDTGIDMIAPAGGPDTGSSEVRP